MAEHQQQLLDEDIHHALSNNLILSQIFNYLDLESIKNVRLVCKTWSTEATYILGTKTELKVLQIFDNPNSTTIFQVDPNLVKNINVWLHDPTTQDTIKLISFFTENHTFVESLVYLTISELFPLFTLLQTLPFPALQNIQVCFDPFALDKTKAFPTEAIQTKPNLRCIRIHPHDKTQHIENLIAEGFDSEFDTSLKLFLQNLINSAPNLNFFAYTLHLFAPDISQCKAIKRSNLFLCEDGPGFDIQKVEVMLGQMSLRLEYLKFCWPKIDGKERQRPRLMSLQPFPKLHKLKLYHHSQFIQLIEPNTFPNLRSIVMIGLADEDMEKYMSSFCHVMKTVKSVKIVNKANTRYNDNDYCYHLPEALKPLFPNATEIIYKQFRWKRTFLWLHDETLADNLDVLLNICNERKVHYLNVIIPKVTGVLFPCLDYEHDENTDKDVEFKYLYREGAQRETTIEWRCPNLIVAKESELLTAEEDAELLMNALLSTKKMKSVVIQNMFLGFKHNEELWIRICTFVKQHELPVHFNYNDISSVMQIL